MTTNPPGPQLNPNWLQDHHRAEERLREQMTSPLPPATPEVRERMVVLLQGEHADEVAELAETAIGYYWAEVTARRPESILVAIRAAAELHVDPDSASADAAFDVLRGLYQQHRHGLDGRVHEAAARALRDGLAGISDPGQIRDVLERAEQKVPDTRALSGHAGRGNAEHMTAERDTESIDSTAAAEARVEELLTSSDRADLDAERLDADLPERAGRLRVQAQEWRDQAEALAATHGLGAIFDDEPPGVREGAAQSDVSAEQRHALTYGIDHVQDRSHAARGPAAHRAGLPVPVSPAAAAEREQLHTRGRQDRQTRDLLSPRSSGQPPTTR